jgi:hypothetical protein
VFKQESTKANLISIYLCKKGALVLIEAIVLLKGIIKESRLCC